MNVTTPRNVGMNKGTPRIWLEGNKLHEAGFCAGATYTVSVRREVIELTKCIGGEKKVSSKKTDDPLYRHPVIDLHNAGLGDFLGECKRVNVTYKNNVITIRRLHDDAPKLAEVSPVVAPVVAQAAIIAPPTVARLALPKRPKPPAPPEQLCMF